MNNEMNREDDIELHKKQADYFFKNKIPIHVSLINGGWKNGNIVEPISDDFFMLEEREEGLMPIFFLQIKSIDKFMEEDKQTDNYFRKVRRMEEQEDKEEE